MYIGLHVKYLLVQFLIKFEFSRQIFEKKNTQKSDFMKIRPVGAELFHADRWTDGETRRHNEVKSCFSQFCEKRPKGRKCVKISTINPLKPELYPICYLLALLAHHFLHVSRIRVKSLTFR